jgi:hypothetical protein
MSSSAESIEAKSEFIIVKTVGEIISSLSEVTETTTIFIDIDDTVITPVSKTFRKPPYNTLIDDIKKDKNNYSNYETIVSNWRLQRKIMLIDNNWPQLLSKLKEKFKVYALTKMDTGKFGNILSMQEWRYNELKSLGIEFSYDLSIPEESIDSALFYRGVFMTGPNSKSQTISHYLSYLNTDSIVMIDDREDHLQDIKQFCKKKSIKFLGLLFKGLENFQDNPEPSIALFQKEYLIEHAKWLEDEDAEIMIKKL